MKESGPENSKNPEQFPSSELDRQKELITAYTEAMLVLEAKLKKVLNPAAKRYYSNLLEDIKSSAERAQAAIARGNLEFFQKELDWLKKITKQEKELEKRQEDLLEKYKGIFKKNFSERKNLFQQK